MASADMFLLLKDVPGESGDSKHKDEIDVTAWSWGMSNASSISGGGQGTGKVSIQDISFTHSLDKASAVLQLRCCKGTVIPEGTLTCRKSGDDPVEYLVIKLKNVYVTSVSTGGHGGSSLPDETVTLSFEHVTTEYKLQAGDGKGNAAGGLTWDIKANASQ